MVGPEEDKDLENCPCCEDVEDVSICCDNCEQWWHCSCVNLKGLTAEAAEDFHDWKCPYCFVSAFTAVNVLKSAFKSLFGADIEKPIETAVKAEVKRVVPGIIKAVIQETIKEKNFTKTFADVVKAKQEEFTAQASKTIEKSMDSAIKNNQQKIIEKTSVKQDADNIAREKRRRNVIFSGVTESGLLSAEARASSDMNKIEKMVQPNEDGLIVSCHRAGKKVDDRPRLLIVTMESPDLAQTMHCYGSGRKFTTSSGSEIWCNPDLIKADRIANFNARKLQRERREQNGNRNSGNRAVVKTESTEDKSAVSTSPTTNIVDVNSAQVLVVDLNTVPQQTENKSSPKSHGPF